MKRLSGIIILFLSLSAVAFVILKIFNDTPGNSLCFFNWDLYTYFYPMLNYSYNTIKTAVLPLWNPYQLCGIPFMATQAVGLFYPLNFFHLIFPTNVAMEYTYILHISLAGIFMYLLGRTLYLSKFGSAVASCTFMFSGSIIGSIYQTNKNNCAIWIPLAFLLLEKLFQKKKFTFAALLGITLAVQFLSGYMQYLIYTLYAMFFYVVFRLILIYKKELDLKNIFRILIFLFLGGAIALSLSAIQLLPTYELSKMTIRSFDGLSWRWATLGSINPDTFFIKFIFASRKSLPAEGYIGLIPFILAVFSLFNRKRINNSIFFMFIGILAVLLSFGSNMPLYKIYYSLPTGNWLRGPLYFLFLFSFSASILCGIGGDFISQYLMKEKKENNLKWLLIIIIIGIMFLLYRQRADIYLFILFSLFALSLLLLPLNKNKHLQMMLHFFSIILIIFNYFYLTNINFPIPHTNINIYNQYEVFDFIKRVQGFDRTFILRSTNPYDGKKTQITEKFGMINGIYTISDHEPYTPRRFTEFAEVLEHGEFPAATPYTGGYVNFNSDTKNLKLINLLSVKYILEDTSASFINNSKPSGIEKKISNNNNFKLIYDNKFKIYENKNALSRAYFVNDYKIITDTKKIMEELAGDSFDPRKTVVLEENLDAKPPLDNKKKTEHTKIKIIDYKPEDVLISASVSTKGLLVLTDTFFPGWQVFIDGNESKIFRANYLFRAVLLEPGNHEIRFIYNPIYFKIGKNITLSSLIFLIILSCYTLIKKRNLLDLIRK